MIKNIVINSVGSSPAYAGGPDPEDEDEWKKKHPHGRHVDSPKRHQNSKEGIDKPPRDGQAALDSSYEINGFPHRIAIQDNQVVMLRRTRIGEFHSYIVEQWHDLSSEAQKALLRNGYKINPKTGKLK